MSRLPDTPTAVEVETDAQGVPMSVRWELPEPVVEVCARWRVDTDWWRVEISRMYYEVCTPTALLTLFHDLISGVWSLERVHD